MKKRRNIGWISSSYDRNGKLFVVLKF